MKIRMADLRVLVEDTVLQALEAGAHLPEEIILRLPSSTHSEHWFFPAAGYRVLLVMGSPDPTLN